MIRDYITVVSGLPRSGTSLMVRMLDAGGLPVLVDNLRGADEDNPNGYYEFEPVKQTSQDSSWVASAVGKAVKLVHLLLLDLPLRYRYRVVFMRRALDEVIASQNRMLARSPAPPPALPAAQLMRIYKAQTDKVLSYLTSHSGHFQYLEANYTQIVADPARHLPAVSAFLDGLALGRMLAVVEPSLYRNRSGACGQQAVLCASSAPANTTALTRV